MNEFYHTCPVTRKMAMIYLNKTAYFCTECGTVHVAGLGGDMLRCNQCSEFFPGPTMEQRYCPGCLGSGA